MIYLFDDKESRQQSYGWTNNKFELWSDVIVRIKDYSDYLSLEEQDIFSERNIIIYHESFSTCIPYEERRSYQAFHNALIDGSELPGINIAIFSGSIASRAINKNVAHVPVTDMYANLECFLGHYREQEIDFKYLLWGEEYKIEQTLLDLIEDISNEISLVSR